MAKSFKQMSVPEFNRWRYEAEKQIFTDQATWQMKYKGKQFRSAGLVYPKWYVMQWQQITGMDPAEFFEISDKPGWQNNQLYLPKVYTEYLKNVIFAV